MAYAKSKPKYASSIPDLKDGSKIITSDESKVTIFNSKLPFLKVYSRKKTKHYQSLNQYVRQISAMLFFSEDKVKKKLLNPCRSPRADNLHPRIVRYEELSVSLLVPFSVLFPESIKHQKLPQDCKDAIITPLYKKDEKCLASSYRPISLTSVVCKITESIIKDD